MLLRSFPRRTLIILLIATFSLAACSMGATPAPTVDLNAINTAAVATAMGQISAQQTQTALAAPSDTPLPTDTPIPQATFGLPTTAVAGASPVGNTPGLPTLSFNTTPNTTQVAGFTPVSGSPVARFTPAVLGDSCHNSIYIADVTIPDGTVLKPGVDFEKIWRIQNTGTCTWDDGYVLAFVSGDQALDPASFKIERKEDFVAGGETADIGVNLTAPNAEGSYAANW